MGSPEALQDKFQRNVVFRMRVRLTDDDALDAAVSAVTDQGACAGEAVLVARQAAYADYDVQVFAADDSQMAAARKAAGDVPGCSVQDVLDEAMETHRGGACEVRSRTPITSNTDLRIVYTPGVARVCRAIEADPALARD
ncbi:MAG: hypothetical protein KAU28_02030, partial [Phycisphaerae bacterium]|nr:hypothetical protein [Phycisphaerae bacterium]